MRKTLVVALAAAALLGSAAAAQNAPKPAGYLPADALAPAAFLPPPPAAGSAAEAADRAAYRDALALAGAPRWAQAAADDDDSTTAVYRNYRCALGLEVRPGGLPALDRVLERTWSDAARFSEAAKPNFKRPRPFVGDDPAAPLCVAMSPERRARASSSYPSGHATLGFLRGLILAELAPDRADAVLARSQSFVESRRICRLHHASDLDAGRVLAAALYARLQADPAFRADMDAARAEVAAARVGAAATSACPAG